MVTPIANKHNAMKEYSYSLFPKPLVIAGYALICLAFVLVGFNVISSKGENDFNDFVSSAALIFISLILITFKSKIMIDAKSNIVVKESEMLGMTLSSEKIKIPGNCDKIFIKQKDKRGTGYYKFVLPVSYSIKSFDMFFYSKTGTVRLINTDYKRAIKIAEFFKATLKLEYILELPGSLIT